MPGGAFIQNTCFTGCIWEFHEVKVTASAQASIHRLSMRYSISRGFADPAALFSHPVSGALWLLICLARQFSFLILRLRGYRG
jgi:hypothetical protein